MTILALEPLVLQAGLALAPDAKQDDDIVEVNKPLSSSRRLWLAQPESMLTRSAKSTDPLPSRSAGQAGAQVLEVHSPPATSPPTERQVVGTRTTQLLPPKQHAAGAQAVSHSVPNPTKVPPEVLQASGVNTAQLELMQHAPVVGGGQG